MTTRYTLSLRKVPQKKNRLQIKTLPKPIYFISSVTLGIKFFWFSRFSPLLTRSAGGVYIGSDMDHLGAVEERIVTDRIRKKLEEVNSAAQEQLASVQDHVNFTLQVPFRFFFSILAGADPV